MKYEGFKDEKGSEIAAGISAVNNKKPLILQIWTLKAKKALKLLLGCRIHDKY